MNSVAGFTWQELLSVSAGQVVSHHRPFVGVYLDTDTRTLDTNSFFLPLKGQNFEGNAYIEAAYEKGAQGAFVAADYLAAHPELKRFPNLIAVPDPMITLLALGRCHRRRCGVQVVAITGSSGKTTTKEMLFTLLAAAHPGMVQKSEKNFNNEVGVSLTLLSIVPETRYLVVEMGMRGLGQIALLTEYAEPNIAVVTNVGPAHIGLLGSLDAIARAKCEIFQGLSLETGKAIINGDDPLLVEEASRHWDGYMDTFSLHEVEDIHRLPEGGVQFRFENVLFSVGMPGSHTVMNMLASLKACQQLEIPLKKLATALEHFEPGGARWQKAPVPGRQNLWVLNDAYNANPSSMKVALEAFLSLPAPGLQKVVVLGDMAELGDHSESYHREIGRWLDSRTGLAGLIVVGEDAHWIADEMRTDTMPVFIAGSREEVAGLLEAHWPQEVLVLLKASRSAQLEEIPGLLAREEDASHAVS